MSDELPEDTVESKIDATHRLQTAGLWEEASRYRAERRNQYRNAGLTKKEAGGKAWDDMRLKFPRPGTEPVEPPEIKMPEPEPEPEPEEPPVHIPGKWGSIDVADDVAWAYEYLNDQNIRADQAPSAGAWNMLQYGRSARHKFLELVTRYDTQQKKDEEEPASMKAEAADFVKAIDKLRSITTVIHYDAVLDAIRQRPDEVVKALKKAGWGVTMILYHMATSRSSGGGGFSGGSFGGGFSGGGGASGSW